MKKIITIQHTQAVHHTNGMMGSWTDWELTELGKQHAESIGRKLSAELKGQEYKIYSSDLIRARQTAEPLARYMGIEIEYREKLREHNIGEAVGKTRQWAKENALPVANPFDDPQFRGAETWRELWNRVAELCDEIAADEAENIILVSHGGTLSVLQAVWLGLEIKEFNRFGTPGGVSLLGINDNGERVMHRVNDLSYMEAYMSTKKTLYISDLDGTLLNKSAEVSEYTMNALNNLITKGIHFTIATARTLASSAKILNGLSLRLPIVLMNGAVIYDMGRKQYSQVNNLTPKSVMGIIKTLRQFEITGFMYELKDGELMTYHESLEQKPLRDFVEERIAKYYKAFRHTDGFDRISPENVIYFTLLDRRERLLPVHDALVSQEDLKLTLYEDNYRPGFWYLELFSDKASKQNAVEYLREAYGYERIVGFGDNLNDLPMFAACDVKVAVENAKPEVKAAADYICDTNDNDGVVKWLEENQ